MYKFIEFTAWQKSRTSQKFSNLLDIVLISTIELENFLIFRNENHSINLSKDEIKWFEIQKIINVLMSKFYMKS